MFREHIDVPGGLATLFCEQIPRLVFYWLIDFNPNQEIKKRLYDYK